MNSQQFECSATPGKPRQRAQSATRRDLLAALEQPDPHGAFKVTGDIGTSRTLILDTPVASPERYCAAVRSKIGIRASLYADIWHYPES